MVALIEILLPPLARIAPIRQRLAVELPVERLAAAQVQFRARAEDVPSHAVDGVPRHFACVTLDQVQIARRIQADEAVDAPVRVAFGVNEVPALRSRMYFQFQFNVTYPKAAIRRL